MKIAFIDHSYHRTTKSSGFFIELLNKVGTVSFFYDESWCGGKNNWRHDFKTHEFDVVVVWQAHEALSAIDLTHPNVVFVPMYDAMLTHNQFYWHNTFARVKCLSFCRKLHQELQKRGALSEHFRYFPNFVEFETVGNYNDLRAFFWQRRPQINRDVIERLSEGTVFDLLTIHQAVDPGWPAPTVSYPSKTFKRIEISRWFETSANYRSVLSDHNVFFSPRNFEGIGIATLEAMASGMCVVAPNCPTMNEYISNGTNGLLWSVDRPNSLDFTRASELGARARESVERGFAEWTSSIPDLMEFVMTPRGDVRTMARGKSSGRSNSIMSPSISVVTVCLNSASCLQRTIESVLEQDHPDVEYLIFDGGSTDGTVDIIRANEHRLSYWQSESDLGVYHAMNSAIARCSNEFVLFMNAGDSFSASDSLGRMVRFVPKGTDVVYGHHLYRIEEGNEEYHPAADFEVTWDRLRKGDFWFDWLAGIPGHQATAVRRTTLETLRFDTSFRIAADHDLLFRARLSGAKFFNSDELVSIYVGGGLSAKNYDICKREWLTIAEKYGNGAKAREFYAQLDRVESGQKVESAPPSIELVSGFASKEGPYASERLPAFRWMLAPSAMIKVGRAKGYFLYLRLGTFLPNQMMTVTCGGEVVDRLAIKTIRKGRNFTDAVIDISKFGSDELILSCSESCTDDTGREMTSMLVDHRVINSVSMLDKIRITLRRVYLRCRDLAAFDQRGVTVVNQDRS